MMETRKVGVFCVCVCKRLDVRGTKRNSWGGCKLLRSGKHEQEWNGMRIVLSKELKEDLINVSRNSDPVMSIELGLEEMVVNIMRTRCQRLRKRQGRCGKHEERRYS